MRIHLIIRYSIALSFLLTACGGTKPTDPVKAPVSTVAPATSTDPNLSKQTGNGSNITSYKDAKKAIVRIETTGSFVSFGESQKRAGTWGGSGFLISPDGYIVTNNHVAVGAASIKVFIGGESNSRAAQLVANSECSDLAVLQVTGNDLPYLEWSNEKAEVGTEVYAAGFPLGDPEYTLTKGIISKANTNGDSSWASVEGVIEHDASINPGSSGGPLLMANGKVLGVNYASNEKTRQFFAIGRDQATNIIKRLQTGKPFESIGINGQAFKEKDVNGIWVTSVDSGSPADKAGLRSGDLLMNIEGIEMGKDGTMKDYCSILRSHKREDTLNIKALRISTKEALILDGQLNGRALTGVSVPLSTPTKPAAAVPTKAPTTVAVTTVPANKAASINLINESSYSFDALLFKEPNGKNWGSNILKSVISPGKSVLINEIKPGNYDITVQYQGTNVETLYSVNLTGEHTWRVEDSAKLPSSAVKVFDEPFSDNRNKWGLRKSSDAVTYEPPTQGLYCLAIKKPNYLGWELYDPLKSSNFFAEVKCMPEGKKGAGCGIAYGDSPNYLIWFGVTPGTQKFTVELFNDGKWKEDLIKETATGYINPEGFNNLAIGRQGSKFYAYINGRLVGSKEIGNLAAGQFGIGGSTSSEVNSAIVCMDSLKVWQVQ